MTKNTESYLKGIYLLSQESKLSNKNLAEYLKVSPASVSEMIKKLSKEEYLYNKNKDIFLTEKGIKSAMEIIRKYRIWETFLVEILKLNKEEVHQEAERLEHATSKKVLEKLEKFLEYPKECPCGNPIIYDNEYISTIKLSEASINDKIIILKGINDESLKKYLEEMNILEEENYEIKKIDPFNGSFYLSNSSEMKFIALEAAKLINIYKII